MKPSITNQVIDELDVIPIYPSWDIKSFIPNYNRNIAPKILNRITEDLMDPVAKGPGFTTELMLNVTINSYRYE